MNQALEILYEILFSFFDFVFDGCELFDGVYLGWVLVAVFLTGVMIRSIIALPKSASRVRIKGDGE